MPLRFNSPASDRRDTKPAAITSRMIETKAPARESAARLPANAPCSPRLLGEVPPRTRSIGPSWPDFDARLGVKNMSRSGSAGAAPGRSSEANRSPPTSEGPPRNLDPDGPLTCRYIRGQVVRSTTAGRSRLQLHDVTPGCSWRVSSLGSNRPCHCADVKVLCYRVHLTPIGWRVRHGVRVEPFQLSPKKRERLVLRLSRRGKGERS
jgi:hypothetical protein